MMLEMGAKEVSADLLKEALTLGATHAVQTCSEIQKLASTSKRKLSPPDRPSPELREWVSW